MFSSKRVKCQNQNCYLVSKGFKTKPGTVKGSRLLSIAHPPLEVVKLEEPDDGNISIVIWSYVDRRILGIIFGRVDESIVGGQKNIWR